MFALKRGAPRLFLETRHLRSFSANTPKLFPSTVNATPVDGSTTPEEPKPKRAMSSFMHFCVDYRSRHAGEKLKAKVLGEKWGELSDAEKEQFIVAANNDKVRYEAEKATYEALHGKITNQKKKSKKKAAKDTSVPKKATGYHYYSRQMKANDETIKAIESKGEQQRQVRVLWKALTPEEQQTYKDSATEEYRIALEEYKAK